MEYLNLIQVAVAVSLIVAILMQQRGSGVGGIFGGTGGVFRTKRGIEKKLHSLTIILSASFLIVSLLIVIM